MIGTPTTDISGLFIGIGIMVFFFVLSYLIFQIVRQYKSASDYSCKYDLLQEILLEKVASKKGIDLKIETEKRAIIKKNKFKKQIEEEMYEELFGKTKK